MRKEASRGDVDVVIFRSYIDGAIVVQIDSRESVQHIRVNLNEGTLFDGDPEEGA